MSGVAERTPARATWATGLVCVLVATVPSSYASDRVSLSTSGEVDGVVRHYAGDEDSDGYFELADRFVLTGVGGPWTLGLEARSAVLGPWTDDQPPFELVGPDTAGQFGETALIFLEKAMARYRRRHVDIAAGDFGQSLGRGAALNLVPNPDLDINTTVLGLRTRVDWEPLFGEVAFGVAHPQTISLQYPNEAVSAFPRDLVRSALIGATVPGGGKLSAWGSWFDFEDNWEVPVPLTERVGNPDARILGGSLEWFDLFGRVDAYLEANTFRYLSETWFADDDPTGYTIYGSATAYLGVWTGLFEVKRYLNAEAINVRGGQYRYDYVTPPTLELYEAVTRDSAETIDSPNIVGYHLRVDRRVDSLNSVFSLNWGHFYDLDPLPPTPSKETIGHLYAQWEMNPIEGGRVAATAGYRVDVRSVRSDGEDRTAHASLQIESPRRGKFSTNIHILGDRFEERTDDGAFSYKEGDVSVAVIYDGKYIAAVRWQYTSDPVLLNNPSLGGGSGNLTFLSLSENHFGSVRFDWRPTPSTGLSLFFGARRAGLECGGGQCRFVPAFHGVELSGQLLF